MKISESRLQEAGFRSMGTTVSVALPNPGTDAENQMLFEGVKDIFSANEKIFSRFDPQSELSRMNAGIGSSQTVSAKMLSVLKLAEDYHRRFPEYFDPRILEHLEAAGYDRDFGQLDFSLDKGVPEMSLASGKFSDDFRLDSGRGRIMLKKRIDLAGIVKGWTVDESARYLLEHGRKNFIIEAGGDMFVSGQAAPDQEWTVDVEGVGERVIFHLQDEGVATSGISRRKWRRGQKRYHHLVDPRSPQIFSLEIKSVTVIAGHATEADVLAKVIFLMGRTAGLSWAADRGIKCLIVDYKNQIYVSPEIKKNLV